MKTEEQSATTGRIWRGQPPEVRHVEQRERLLRASAAVVVRVGYPATTADAISREAKMSKATFYVHFDNKEACFLALLELTSQRALEALVRGAREAGPGTVDRQRGGLRAFLDLVGREPAIARAVLVEGMNVGPAAIERRDTILTALAEVMVQDTERGSGQSGGPRFASAYDAIGVLGAVVELTARHLRTGQPERLADVQASVERILFGALASELSGPA